MIAEIYNLLKDALKVYTSFAPQGEEKPYAVLNQISEVPDQDGLCDTGATDYLYQLDCYADSTLDALALKDAAWPLVNRPGEQFALGAYWVGDMRVTSVDVLSELEHSGTEKRVVRYALEISVRAIKQ